MFTLQQIFDKSFSGVRLQGESCTIKSGCKFRANKDGRVLKCGVGHLIDDSEYLYEFDYGENSSSTFFLINESIPFKNALVNSFIDIADSKVKELLFDLQIAHDASSFDNVDFIHYYNRKMKNVAFKFGLTYNEMI